MECGYKLVFPQQSKVPAQVSHSAALMPCTFVGKGRVNKAYSKHWQCCVHCNLQVQQEEKEKDKKEEEQKARPGEQQDLPPTVPKK